MKLKCHACGYEWDYRGKLASATCPSCQSKVKTHENVVCLPDEPAAAAREAKTKGA